MADSMTERPSPASLSPEIDFGGGKAFREMLAEGGRAHVDRPLPFLILSRFASDDEDSLARAVARTSSAYVLWPRRDDSAALAIVEAIVRKQCQTQPGILIVSLYDLPRTPTLDDTDPRLEEFTCRLSATEDAAAQAAAACLEDALKAIEVDLRHCTVEHVSKAYFEPGLEALLERVPGLSHLSLGLPQNYRVPGEDGIYPQLLHDLTIDVFDALLQAFRAFYGALAPDPPASHRAFGRSSFLASALTIDGKLFQIATAFDFLLSVSPINSIEAYDRFKASKYREPPVFRYRPLTVDPDRTKRALYAIDLRRIEDPVLEALFSDKRRELDQQLTMLHCRNTPSFRYSSLMLYGPVEKPLLEAAHDILGPVPACGDNREGRMVDAQIVHDAAHDLVELYRRDNPRFAARIMLREDIGPGLMVSGHKLLISTATRMRRDRMHALLHHEVSVHLLTCVNGHAQGLKIFETGLAEYEGIQEGLGVFAECAVGGLTRARLRLLAARVVAVDAMIEGADFIECFDLLRDTHGFSPRGAFNIAARIYRSGGLAKDAIYLRGFKEVLDLLAAGRSLDPFWFGKIAGRHVPIVEELELRGLLHRPRSLPQFLADPEAQTRIAAMRTVTSLSELI